MDSQQTQAMDVAAENHSIEFRGNAGEFFRIWIVNTLLTLLTLGIYSAWAKVRTNRYFYGNTFLGKASFDYHAKPLQILKGRVILALGLAIYLALGYFAPGSEMLMFLAVMLLMPWLLVRSLVFRMSNTSYRNIRFGFDGSVKESYFVGIKSLLVTILTLGLGSYWAAWLRSRFVVNNLRFGRSRFHTDCKSGQFMSIYLRTVGISIGIILVFIALGVLASIVFAGVVDVKQIFTNEAGAVPPSIILLPMMVYLPVSLFVFTYLQVRKFNLLAGTTLIGKHQLQSELKVGKLFRLYLGNLLMIILSLGLLIPWAHVRVARYRLQQMSVQVVGSLDDELAAEAQAVSATGEEIGDYMDLDLGF